MTETILIDFMELSGAVPRVADLHRALSGASRRLGGLDVGVEMDAAAAARVRAAVDRAASATSRAAASIDGLDGEMADCARLARQAYDLGVVKLVSGPALYQLKMIDGFLSGEADRTWKQSKAAGEGAKATRLAKTIERLKALNRAASLIPSTLADFANPYLSSRQRAGRFAVRAGATKGAASAADAAGSATRRVLDDVVAKNLEKNGTAAALARIAGSRAPFLLGGGVGLAVGIGWTALDLKFGISAKAGDVVADGMGKVADGAGKVADGAGKVVDGVGKAADGVGKAADGIVDAFTP